MNNMKQKIHNKFTNLGGKLRLDRNSESDSLALPSYAESLYMSSKNDKDVYNELYKKMSTICVQNYSITDDKKMKKNSWESLSNLIFESEKKLSDDPLTKEILNSSVKVLDELANNTREFEKVLSSNVIKHFHDLSEDNTLLNAKKNLASLSKEMRANTEKVQILQDQLNVQPSEISVHRKSGEGSNVASTENKLQSAQQTEESTEKEWENKKDFYLTKLFAAKAERFNTAEKILVFFQDYLDFYSESQNIITKYIPEIKALLDKNKHVYAFHVPLEEHLQATNRKLSFVLETCIKELDNEDTLEHEGIFRISGGKSKMELLKNALNVMKVDEFITKGCNSAVFAGVLKQYLRELPFPLMTYDLYDKWCEVGTKIRQNNMGEAMALTKKCLLQIPPCYYHNLAYLMQFLRKICNQESINKMSASNLGLMLGPNLIRNKPASDCEDNEVSAMMMLGSPGGTVLEFMIVHFAELFPDAPTSVTAPRITIKQSDMSSNVSVNEKTPDKTVKKTKQTNGDESLPQGDLRNDDCNVATAFETDVLKVEQPQRFPREAPFKTRSFRKAPAPQPPTLQQNKLLQIENETDTVREEILSRSGTRPTVKKRMSKLERPLPNMTEERDESPSELQGGWTGSTSISPRFNQAPSVAGKRVDIVIEADPPDRPTRPGNVPPKRPNIAPPPIPPFDKLKENLNQKQSSSKPDETKLFPHDGALSASSNSMQDRSAEEKKKHKYSSSDVGHTTF